MASQDARLDSKLAARFGGGAVAQEAARKVSCSVDLSSTTAFVPNGLAQLVIVRVLHCHHAKSAILLLLRSNLTHAAACNVHTIRPWQFAASNSSQMLWIDPSHLQQWRMAAVAQHGTCLLAIRQAHAPRHPQLETSRLPFQACSTRSSGERMQTRATAAARACRNPWSCTAHL